MATYKEIIEYVKLKYNYTPKTCWIADVKEQLGILTHYAHNRQNNHLRKYPCPNNKIVNIIEAIKYLN
jgi:hypothetical protein